MSEYRPGGFILHPIVLAVMLAGVAVWLGLAFALGSRNGVVGIVVAVVLVILGLWLGYFIVMVLTVEAVGLTMWLMDRDWHENRARRKRTDASSLRYLYLLTAPALLVALVLGFGFGYLAGGLFWGLYAAVMTVGFIAVSEFLVARRTSLGVERRPSHTPTAAPTQAE